MVQARDLPGRGEGRKGHNRRGREGKRHRLESESRAWSSLIQREVCRLMRAAPSVTARRPACVHLHARNRQLPAPCSLTHLRLERAPRVRRAPRCRGLARLCGGRGAGGPGGRRGRGDSRQVGLAGGKAVDARPAPVAAPVALDLGRGAVKVGLRGAGRRGVCGFDLGLGGSVPCVPDRKERKARRGTAAPTAAPRGSSGSGCGWPWRVGRPPDRVLPPTCRSSRSFASRAAAKRRRPQ
jgi:hypothetical protein